MGLGILSTGLTYNSHIIYSSHTFVRRSQSSPTNNKPAYTPLFPDFYYYSDMKLSSFVYDKDFNLLLQFPVFMEPYTQKPVALYQLETAPFPIKDNNTHT